VIIGHAGQSHLFRKKLRFLVATLTLLIIAMIARVGADFIPPARNSHLVYAALVWLLAATVWAVALTPKLSLNEE
jgi:membrane protein YdbS with pleckstrin-like domain